MGAWIAAVWLGLLAPGAQPIVPGPPVPAEYELVWEAPPECPEADWLRARVVELLHAPAEGTGVMAVNARVLARDGAFALELTTSYLGEEDRRVLEAGQCSDLAEAVAVVIAMALEPALGLDVPGALVEPPAAIEEPPPAVAPAPEIETPPPRVQPVPPPSRRLVLAVRLESGVEYGALPGTTSPIRVAFGLLWPRVRLEATGTYLVPRRIDGPSGFDALYQLGAAAIRGCARGRIARTELPACVGLEAGGLRVDTRGVTPPQRTTRPWLGPLLAAGVARRWRRVGIWVSGEIAIRAVGARLYLDDALVFRSPLTSLRLLTGVEFFLS